MERSQSAPEKPQAQPQGFSQTDFGPSPNSPNPAADPNNPPAFAPNPRTNVGGDIFSYYFKTTIGILKILSLVIGFVPVVLVFYASVKATALKNNTETHKNGTVSSTRPPLCHRSNTTFCDLDTYFKDPLCEKGRNVETCVSKLLVDISKYFILMAWKVSFFVQCRMLMLIILRRNLRSRSFHQILAYCYLGAAFVIIVSALMLFGYYAQVTEEDLCGKTNLKAEATDYVLNNGPKPNSNSSSPSPSHNSNSSSPTTSRSTTNSSDQHESDKLEIEMVLADLTKRCPDMQAEKYYHLYFLICAIFAIITGILYLAIVAFSKKESSNAVEPARMVMGPNGPQLWDPSTPQAQVQSATNL